MEPFLQIDISQSEFYYPLFYKVAFIVGFLIILGIGIYRKYPLGTWILINTAGTVFGIIGSKIGTYGFAEWQYFFEYGILPDTGHKTAFAGILFGIVGMLLTARFLKFKDAVLDAYIWSIPIAAIFMRMGCLFAGCCYGLPYEGFSAISYGGTGHLLYQQMDAGLIGLEQTATLPVHNIPLYDILISLSILLTVSTLRKNFKNKTALGFFGFALIFGFRFFLEFFRDSMSNHSWTETVWGLKELQWGLLATTLLLLGISYFFEFYKKQNKAVLSENHSRLALGILSASLIVLLLRDWFTGPEVVVIHGKLVLSLLVVVFVKIKAPSLDLKWSPALMAVLAIFVMSQSYPHEIPFGDKGETTLNFGISAANMGTPVYPCAEVGDGCGGPTCVRDNLQDPYGPNYRHLKIGIERRNPFRRRTAFLYGAEANSEWFNNAVLNNNHILGNGSVYLGWEGRRFWGMKLGLRAGKIIDRYDHEAIAKMRAYPVSSMWLGYKKYAVLEGRLFDDQMTGGSLTLGSWALHLNTKNWIHENFEHLRIGKKLILQRDLAWDITAQFKINEKFSITPNYSKYSDTYDRNFESFSVGLKYKLQPK